VIRVLGEGGRDRQVDFVFEGYQLDGVHEVDDTASFDPDFVLGAPASVWRPMLNEISREGHPSLRRTLSSLVLVGDEMWLESADQLREDRFYRFNQTLQEFFNPSGRGALV
jgi:hypothetical protein